MKLHQLLLLMLVLVFTSADRDGVEVKGVHSKSKTLQCPGYKGNTTTLTWFRDTETEEMVQILHNHADGVQHDFSSSKYVFDRGTGSLTINDLQRKTDQGLYQCHVPTSSPRWSSYKLEIFEDPAGLEMSTVSLGDNLVNFICSTNGGSKPAIRLEFNWHNQKNINKKIPQAIEVNSKGINGETDFWKTTGKLTLKLGPQNAYDYVTCFGENQETGSTFNNKVELVPPKLAHGTMIEYQWRSQKINSMDYKYGGPVLLPAGEKGIINVKLTPDKFAYEINETVTIKAEGYDLVTPEPKFSWFKLDYDDNTPTEEPDSGSEYEFVARKNTTIFMYAKNQLGDIMIRTQIEVIPGSSYKSSVDDGNDDAVSMGSSTTLILIIACSLLAIVVIVILGVYCKNKKQKKMITDTYEVKQVQAEHDEEMALRDRRQEEQQAVGETAVQAHPQAENKYDCENESLVKAPIDEEGEESQYNYPPSNDFSDEYSHRSDYHEDRKYAGGDNVSIRSGSTIYIDDETYPLEEDEKKQLSMSGGDVIV